MSSDSAEKTKRIIVEVPEKLFWDYKKTLADNRQNSTEVIKAYVEQYTYREEKAEC